jgi:hypothetical protein
VFAIVALLLRGVISASAAETGLVTGVELQPFVAQVKRIEEALSFSSAPRSREAQRQTGRRRDRESR